VHSIIPKAADRHTQPLKEGEEEVEEAKNHGEKKKKKRLSVYKNGRELIADNGLSSFQSPPPEIGCYYYSQTLSATDLTANNSPGSDALLQS